MVGQRQYINSVFSRFNRNFPHSIVINPQRTVLNIPRSMFGLSSLLRRCAVVPRTVCCHAQCREFQYDTRDPMKTFGSAERGHVHVAGTLAGLVTAKARR